MSSWDDFRKRVLADIETVEKNAAKPKKGEDDESDEMDDEEIVDEMDDENAEAGAKKSRKAPKAAEDKSEEDDSETEESKESASDKEEDDDSSDKPADDEDDKKKDASAKTAAGSECDDEDELDAEKISSAHFARTNSWVFFHNDTPLGRVTCHAAFGDTEPKTLAFFASDNFIKGIEKNFKARGVMETLRTMKAEIFNLDRKFTASPKVDPVATRAEVMSDFSNIAGMVIEAMQKNLIPNPLKSGMFQVFANAGIANDEKQLISLVEDVTALASADYTNSLIEHTLRYMAMTEGERKAAYDLISHASLRDLGASPGRNEHARELARNSMNIATAKESDVVMDRELLNKLI